MILTDLATVCRSSGLTVVEVPGWKTRGHGVFEAIESITAHHTGSQASAKGDYPTLATVRDGRSDLRGPLSQLGLGRSGTVYVIAAGVAWHAGAVFEEWQNNWHAIGIEAEHPGGSAPWPKVQYDAYVRLCAALRIGYDVPVSRVVGHKEIAKPKGRKPDPNFDMDVFRDRVAAVRPAGGGTTTPPPEDEVTLDELMNAQITGTVNGETKNFGSLRGVLWTLMARTADDDARTDRLEKAISDLTAAVKAKG
jgi:hypothetical protein